MNANVRTSLCLVLSACQMKESFRFLVGFQANKSLLFYFSFFKFRRPRQKERSLGLGLFCLFYTIHGVFVVNL